MEVAEFAVSAANEGVIAYGIGGDEVRGPAQWFRDVFAYARDGGLHWCVMPARRLGRNRFGPRWRSGRNESGMASRRFGIPALLARLREANVPLEVCISSNVCTGAVPSLDAHPVRQLYHAGVPITIHTDDPAFFQTTLAREYELAETSSDCRSKKWRPILSAMRSRRTVEVYSFPVSPSLTRTLMVRPLRKMVSSSDVARAFARQGAADSVVALDGWPSMA